MIESVGQRIAARRRELKMSADELAERIGKSRATIYRYESGAIGSLPADALLPLATALKTNPNELLGSKDITVGLTNDELLLLEKYNALDDDGKRALMIELDKITEQNARKWQPKLTKRDIRQVERDFAAMNMASAAYADEDTDDEEFATTMKKIMLDAKLRAKKTYTPKKYRK